MSDRDEAAYTRLRSNIESVRASGEDAGLTAEVRELIDTAENVAAATEGTFGSCERGKPFADMFLVARADGKLVWRCEHDPAHPDIPVS